jgi:hypothetical protein
VLDSLEVLDALDALDLLDSLDVLELDSLDSLDVLLLDSDDSDEVDDSEEVLELGELWELDDMLLEDWLELERLELLELSPRGSIGRDSNPKLGGIDTARVWQTSLRRLPFPLTVISQRT